MQNIFYYWQNNFSSSKASRKTQQVLTVFRIFLINQKINAEIPNKHGEYFFHSGTGVLLSGAGPKKRWKLFSKCIYFRAFDFFNKSLSIIKCM